jgi:hypothetical protein
MEHDGTQRTFGYGKDVPSRDTASLHCKACEASTELGIHMVFHDFTELVADAKNPNKIPGWKRLSLPSQINGAGTLGDAKFSTRPDLRLLMKGPASYRDTASSAAHSRIRPIHDSPYSGKPLNPSVPPPARRWLLCLSNAHLPPGQRWRFGDIISRVAPTPTQWTTQKPRPPHHHQRRVCQGGGVASGAFL